MIKGIIPMNTILVRQHKYRLLISLLFFWMTNTALAGSFNRGVMLHFYDHTFTWADADFDGIRNDVDPDDDNDGVPDKKDAFPYNRKESVDTDRDGIGNNADKDDDNDGVPDKKDAFPYNRKESVDTDRDGIGNNTDKDDDNDGVPDNKDAFPYNSKESVDTDLDGIGNNADRDDDNDGFLDYQDAFPLDRNKSKSMAYCGLNMIMTCDRKGNCGDRHYPDPRCLKPTTEPNASKLRLLGFDSNRDGIRDDIERKIDAKFTGSIRAQTRDMAKNYQKILSGALSHKQINQHIAEIMRLDSCIHNAALNRDDIGLDFITHRQLSTVERTKTYLQRAAGAYDAEGPPIVKPCGNKAQNHIGLEAFIASTQGGVLLRNNSNARARLNPPNLNGYELFFINGVLNDKEKARETEKKLERMLDQKTVALAYNKNHMLGQLFDLWVHKTGEIEIDRTGTLGFWQLVRAVALPTDKIRKALYDWLDPDRDIGHWAEKDLKRMIQSAKTALIQNKKVIIVAHSEGNFFYRNIYKALNQWNSTKTQQCFAGIGFATPLSSKPGNYDFITSSNDRIINLVRSFWNSTLAANITVPKGYGGDLLGHGMQKVYLSHPNSLRQLKTELDQVSNRLNKSCKIKKKKKTQPKKQPKPTLNCSNLVGKDGGQGQYSYSYPITNTRPHKVEISFEAYNVPDSIRITANGKNIAQTNGLVGGFHQWQIDYDPIKHGKQFIAHVDAPNGGTAWKLCIDCEGSSCDGNIKRKKVHYNFIDSNYWKCDNHKIDGQIVNRYGEKHLSVGKHSFSASCECNTFKSFCNNPFYGFPVISASGSTCSFNPRKNESCSILYGSKVLEIK